MDTSESGDEIYAAGYFSTAQGLAAFRAAELSATTASPDPQWQPVWSSNNGNYQQAIQRSGDRVYVGGAEHSFFGYDASTLQRVSGTIGNQGGDFQTASPHKDLVYASCHCNDYMYSEAFTWSNVGTNWTYADKVGYVGAWDAATGKFQAEFDPILDVRRGRGGWASTTDTNGDTWFGGDFTRGRLPNGTSTWAGGFVRFAERDIAAPTTPGAMSVVSNTPTGARLSWGASTGQAARYELIRGNRVVATSGSTSIDVPPITEPTRFFVRAIDAAGNRSASTSVLVAQPPGAGPAAPAVSGEALSASRARVTWTHAGAGVASYKILRDGAQVGSIDEPGRSFEENGLTASTTYAYQVVAVGNDGQESAPGGVSVTTLAAATQLIPTGADWRWRYDTAAWPADWRERTFDDSSWALDPAVLGFGSNDVTTNIDKPAPTTNRPVSAQFRRSFDVADPNALSSVSLTVRADDSVVVYVNGTEVGRSNLPSGTLTQYSYALTGTRTATAAANPVTFTVPKSLLVAGTNVVAASVHLGWRATPDVSFELSMSGQ